MAGSESDDSGFGDELVITSTKTARTGSAGVGAPAAAEAAGGKKTKTQGANGMAQVRAARMLVVHTYDLSTDVDHRKFALEMILRHSIAEMDTDVNTLPAAESKALRTKDTDNVVDFWSAEPRAHGGVVSMFNAHFGSMSLGHLGTEYTDTKYWQQLEIGGVRAKHN